MFRLFFFVMFALLFVFGCSGFEADPISVVSVSPPDGSTLQPFEDIVIEFTEVPENLHVHKVLFPEYGPRSEKIWLDGRIATIHAPFSYFQENFDQRFTTMRKGLELHVYWGRPDEWNTHVLKYSVEPDWTDGVLTITIGKYQDVWEMYEKLKDRRIISNSLSSYMENVSLSRSPKRVDVTVVQLLDIGFSQPVTLEEISNRFSELGYRPLTLEEAIELSIHFYNQPSDDALMNGFTALLSEESMQLLPRCVLSESDFGKIIGPCDEDKEIEEILGGTLQIVHNSQITGLSWQRAGPSLRVRWFFEDTLLDPYDLSNSDNVFTQALSKFACVMEK